MASVERLFLLCPLLGRSTIGGSTVLPSRMILYPFAKYSETPKVDLPDNRTLSGNPECLQLEKQ